MIRNELMIQNRRLSSRIFFMIVILLGMISIYLVQKNIEEMEFLNDYSLYESSTFPPIADGIMLFMILFLSTAFMILGFSETYIDRKNRVFQQRLLLLGGKKYCIAKVIGCVIRIAMVWTIVLAVAWGAQAYFGHALEAHSYIGKMGPSLLLQLLYKAGGGGFAFLGYYICGCIIAVVIRNVLLGVGLSLLVDQLVLSNSIIFQWWVYGSFSDTRFLVSVPGTEVNMGVAIAAVLFFTIGLCILYACTVQFFRNGYET